MTTAASVGPHMAPTAYTISIVPFAGTSGVCEVRYQKIDEKRNVRTIKVTTVIFGLIAGCGESGMPGGAGFSIKISGLMRV